MPKTIIFAGGGSGGHISPGLAIAERLKELSPESRAIFVCSQRAIDATMLTDAREEFVPIPATPPSIKPLAASRFILNFIKSKRLVRNLIRDRKVDHVVALGGFIAAPAVSAARSAGVPVMLVNLDAPPGKANQWMAKKCDEVFSAIEIPMMPGFASRVVGMPIRRRALAPGDAQHCRSRLGMPIDTSLLFITGASQGATSVNSFMTALAQSQPDLFRGWHVYHLAGHGADGPIRAAYEGAGISATVEPFLNEIGLAWGAADLAISRAGASSVAEAAAKAVPTLFLPYPYPKDMHQKHNAQPLVDFGGAVMAVDQIDANANVREVGPVLTALMNEPMRCEQMKSALVKHRPQDAAMIIARMLTA
jgi:UDP-N-acetylglucosamine--N-acetylmuramyl-(pentapeptide) pyrophosphoryl-undecaprenol N-acetylglucosamine transferase